MLLAVPHRVTPAPTRLGARGRATTCCRSSRRRGVAFLRTLAAAVAFTAGCWMSHPDLSDEDRRPCRDDSTCDDGDPCTHDRCDPDGRCEHGPAPMGDRRDFAPFSLPTGMAVIDAEAHILVGGSTLHRFDLDGPVGDPVFLPGIGGDRDWDSSLARVGDDLAVVTHTSGGLDLRLVSSPDVHDRVEPAGLFVHLGFTGRHLVACTDWMDTCGLAWGRPDGTWISTATESTPGACPIAWVPNDGTSTTGHPVNRVPAYAAAGGEAVYLSVDGDGGLHRLVASPGSQRVDRTTLDSPGPRYFHSFVAAAGDPGIAALWVQTETDDAPEQEVRFARFDADLRMTAGPIGVPAAPGAYVFRMALVWCEGRFVAVWNDQRGTAFVQIGSDGEPLGEVERLGRPLTAGWMNLACLPRGVLLADANETAIWRCPAE